MSKIGRNDKCSCGSGKKYKKCCGARQDQTGSSPNPTRLLARQFRDQAVALHRAGQLAEAVDLYEKVVNLDPADGDVWFELGRLTYPAYGSQSPGLIKAISYLQKAAELLPADVEVHVTLAHALTKNFDMEVVCDFTTEALKRFAGNIDLMALQGSALAYLNRNDEAKATLERANNSRPYSPEIVSPLAKVYSALGLQDQARGILQACVEKNPHSQGVIAIWNDLAKIADKEGRYNEAFEAFTRSGEIQLAAPELQHWQPEKGIDIADGYTHWISEGGLASLPSPDMNSLPARDRRLVFFVGFPRSGTTLTEQVMAAHSRVCTSEEKPHLGTAIEQLYRRYRTSHDKKSIDVIQRCKPQDLEQLRIDYWQDVDARFDIGERVFIDKLPLNISFIAWIQAAFPDAKLIVALRDPRDVCLSCFFQYFMPNFAMNYFLRWPTTTQYYRHVMALWLQAKQHLTLSWSEVKYEDTVMDLESQARKLIDFLDLDWEDGVLNYREALQSRAVATPSHEAIRQPVYQSAKERWRNYPQATLEAKADLEAMVEVLGYQW